MLLFELSRCHQNRPWAARSALTERDRARAGGDAPALPDRAAVACRGEEGSPSQLACERLFKQPNEFFFDSYEAVFSAIEKGLCRYGVLPLENSAAGSVNAVYDLMMRHHFNIVRSVRTMMDAEGNGVHPLHLHRPGSGDIPRRGPHQPDDGTAPQPPGLSLYKGLARFYALGININKLESRPMPERNFEFMFYFDLETSVYSPPSCS